ncbi:MAG: DUF2059 domain-containing protein [Methylobacter sp.]
MKTTSKIAIFSAFLLITACDLGREVVDTPEARSELADEYFKLVSFNELIKDAATEIASKLPAEQRLDFIELMTKEVRLDLLETVAKQSLTKHMTAQELNTFVEFMQKPEGKSAMSKMKLYIADIMPVMQDEITRAMAKQQKQLNR